MKKYLSLIIVALLCVMMAVAASAKDVYLTDGGNGDGTEAAPFGKMDDAIEAIAEEGGTVHIVGAYTCPDQYYEPEHAGNIVIADGTYIFDNGSYNRYFLSGPGSTTFKNVTFEYGAGNQYRGSSCLFIAQFNELIFDEGIVFPETATVLDKEGNDKVEAGRCYVLGGYQHNSIYPGYEDAKFKSIDELVATVGLPTDRDSHITAKSGRFHLIAGFCRGATTADLHFSGKSYITVSDNAVITSGVYGGSVNGKSSFAGSEITITGGDVAKVYTTGHDNEVEPATGDVVVNVSGGVIGTINMFNVLGKTIVNCNGGGIANAEYVMAETLVAPEVDPEATLAEGEEPVEIVMHPATYLVEAIDGTTKLVQSGEGRVTQMLVDKFDEFEGVVFDPLAAATQNKPAVTTAAVVTTGVVDGGAGGSFPIWVVVAIVAVLVVVAVVVTIVIKKKKN